MTKINTYTKTQMVRTAIDLFKTTLKADSKFYGTDVRDFTARMSGKSYKDVKGWVDNFRACCSDAVKKDINKMCSDRGFIALPPYIRLSKGLRP